MSYLPMKQFKDLASVTMGKKENVTKKPKKNMMVLFNLTTSPFGRVKREEKIK